MTSSLPRGLAVFWRVAEASSEPKDRFDLCANQSSATGKGNETTRPSKARFDHTGSSFDSFLEKEGILEEVESAAIKRVSAWQSEEHGSESPPSPLDIAAQASAEEGIRPGLDDAKNGRVRAVREFFDEFEATNGIPR